MKFLFFCIVSFCLACCHLTSRKIYSKNDSELINKKLFLYIKNNRGIELESGGNLFRFYIIQGDKLESEYVYDVLSYEDSVKIGRLIFDVNFEKGDQLSLFVSSHSEQTKKFNFFNKWLDFKRISDSSFQTEKF